MRLIVFILVLLSVLGCRHTEKTPQSYWEGQKEKFQHKNLKEFVLDSTLLANFRTYQRIIGKAISLSDHDDYYLYSWQERDSSKNEFTVIADAGEHGVKIYYLIFNKSDSLLSSNQISGLGHEGGYSFEVNSRFISDDTISQIGAISELFNEKGKIAKEKILGDTTFYQICIDEQGNMKSNVIKEVFKLNFGKEN